MTFLLAIATPNLDSLVEAVGPSLPSPEVFSVEQVWAWLVPLLAKAELLPIAAIEHLAREFGYWAVFVGIALENAGLPLPGETIVLVAGFLAGNGDLNLPGVMGSAIAGAILGDNLGYWLGRWGGWPLLERLGKLFRFSDEKLLEARRQFTANAGKAVFLGRFVALLRIFAGPLAGIVEMPYGKFLAYNAAGAAVWGGLTIGLAYGVGRMVPLETMLGWFNKFTFVAIPLVLAWFIIPIWWENRKSTQG